LSKLPSISARDAIRTFERLGYEQCKQLNRPDQIPDCLAGR
jgi:hypothetical protein